MFEGLMRWISGASDKVILAAADLREGNCVLEGRLQGNETLLSPASRIPCLAFYYRATYLAASRVKKSVRRRLRDALCYAPEMRIELEGGAVSLVPKTTELFTPEDHEALIEMGAEGIKISEERVVANGKVRVSGRLKKVANAPDEWRMVFHELTPVAGDESPEPTTRIDKKSARANRKKVKSRRGKS